MKVMIAEKSLASVDAPGFPDAVELSRILAPLSAPERIRELHAIFGKKLVASTSFGLQSPVMLHLIRENAPEIPVVFIDTGYAFDETYQFSQPIIDNWGLDIRIFTPTITPARQEALYGKLWEQGEEGANRYALINKVEPMNRALTDLGAAVWLSGLRRSHSRSRVGRPFAEQQSATMKAYPILDWADPQLSAYFYDHDLPRHPLEEKGYVTMGDWHSTRPQEEGESVDSTRFDGQKYECGLHEDSGQIDFQI